MERLVNENIVDVALDLAHIKTEKMEIGRGYKFKIRETEYKVMMHKGSILHLFKVN